MPCQSWYISKVLAKIRWVLPHFWLMFLFYNPWKHQKIFGFLLFSVGIRYKTGTLTRNGLIIICVKFIYFNSWSTNPKKCSKTLVGNLSVFNHFVGLALSVHFPKRHIHILQKCFEKETKLFLFISSWYQAAPSHGIYYQNKDLTEFL